MADDADSIMRAWRRLLHGRPDTGRYADHMMRIYNPAGDRSTALRIMKDLLMEGYWHGGSPKEADFDTKPAWYDGLDDGRTLSIICGISASPDSLKRDRSLPYDKGKAEGIIIHDDDGPLPVGFDDAFAFLPYNYCTYAGGVRDDTVHQSYTGLDAYLQVVCGRMDGLPPDLTGYEDPALHHVLIPVTIPYADVPMVLQRERNPHFHTAMRIVAGANALCTTRYDDETMIGFCSWKDMRVLTKTACRYDHAGMFAWVGRSGIIVDEGMLDNLLLDHPSAATISGSDWHAMSVRLMAAMDRAFALLRSIGDAGGPDADRRMLTETIRMGLSSFMDGRPDSLTFMESAFDLFQAAGAFDDDSALQAGGYEFGPYTPGMFGTAPFDEARAYGLPFAKEEIIREMSGQ